MSQITVKGTPTELLGSLPKVGAAAPDFTLCAADLSDIALSDFQGKNLILNIFPSIDTPTCSMSVRMFNEKVSTQENTAVLCISADLPFATGRFCGAEGLDNVQTASFFRSPEFTENYGVKIADGALRSLSARAVVVINESGVVVYEELVPELADEPNYEQAFAALK